MNQLNETIEAIACKMADIIGVNADLLGVRGYAGQRDGNTIFHDGQKELTYSDTQAVFAMHVINNMKQRDPDPWQNTQSIPGEVAIDAKATFVLFGATSLHQDKLTSLLLAFNTSYTTSTASAEITFSDYTDNLPQIIKATWRDSWSLFQPKQMILNAVKIEYNIGLSSCKLC